MRKYFLLSILFVAIILGCEKNDKPEYATISGISFKCYGEELTIGDLSREDLELYAKYANCVCGKDSNFYVYGFKDNKLYIKEFEKQTKQNVWSFVSKTNFPIGNTVTINEGYGVINTYRISGSSVEEILKYEDDFALVINNLLKKVEGKGSNNRLFNLFIVSNGNESLIDIVSRNPNIYLYEWFENSFLLSYTNTLSSWPCLQCYSYSGDLLYETQFSYETQFKSQEILDVLRYGIYLPLNFDEYLFRTGFYADGYFKRYNLKENKEIWKSKAQITLPPNVRIDFQWFEIIDKDFTKYTIKYTTYEGDKKAIAFKINNNTGEYVQL
jgi:hypothetical protein